MRLTTLFAALAFLAPVFIGIVLNQLNPSLETALGVAYFALLGLVLGVLTTALILVLKWRDILAAPNVWVVGVSFVVSLVLFLKANSGALSAVGP